MKVNYINKIVASAVLLFQTVLIAGVPFNNLEGVGGAAFNPFAYPANPTKTKDSSGFNKFFGNPQVGLWYVNLGESDVEWTTTSIASTLWGRLEVSYGYEHISPIGENITKQNFGTKLLLIEENSDDNKWLPAVSVGFIGKHTKDVPLANTDSSGYDFYLVATKFITELPKPVLLSGGILSTDGQVTGVYGYNDDRDEIWFGNIDILPVENIAVGIEYKQGAKFDDGFKNANYWDIHLAWFINPDTSLVAAYVNAGNEKSNSKVGLGEGVVLSIQYAF